MLKPHKTRKTKQIIAWGQSQNSSYLKLCIPESFLLSMCYFSSESDWNFKHPVDILKAKEGIVLTSIGLNDSLLFSCRVYRSVLCHAVRSDLSYYNYGPLIFVAILWIDIRFFLFIAALKLSTVNFVKCQTHVILWSLKKMYLLQ